jgi:transcription antitermination protein NusB
VSARQRRGKPGSAEGRHNGREAALQMLYQWEIGRGDPDEVLGSYWGIEGAGRVSPSDSVKQFANRLFSGTVGHLEEIDPLISGSAEHWRLPRMAVTDRLIIRLAAYELLHETGTPPAVVINEALELARTFGEDESVRFVNGVLDAIRRQLQQPRADGDGSAPSGDESAP